MTTVEGSIKMVITLTIGIDNRHGVPYNMAMLKKFQGHINVEWCNKTQVMKYLFKYVTKGADYSKVMLERLKNRLNSVAIQWMRFRSIRYVVIYVSMMHYVAYLGFRYTLKCHRFKGSLFICVA